VLLRQITLTTWHGSDTEPLVDGGWACKDLRLGLLEGTHNNVRVFARECNPARHVSGFGHHLPDCPPIGMKLHLDELKRFELSIKADRQADDFEFPAVLRGLNECRHDQLPSCAASQL
jgi:hypothetical protein